MKAIVQDRYGAAADVWRLEDVSTPQAGANKVVVKVRAAAVDVVSGTCWPVDRISSG